MSASNVVRVLSATALAAVAAALLAGLFAQSLQIVPIAFFLALPHASLGLAAFLVLRSRGPVTMTVCLIAGYLIGAIPLTLFASFSPQPSSAGIEGVLTVMDGRRTLAGWRYLLRNSAILGIYGSFAGAIFWLIAKPSFEAIGNSTGRHSTLRGGSRSALYVTLAAAATVAIFSIPYILADRTCHNPLRDGRKSINPEINIKLHIGADEWDEFAAVVGDFGRSIGWSVRQEMQNGGNTIHILDESICNEEGTKIGAVAMIFPASGKDNIFSDTLPIGVYQPQGGDSWKDPTKKILGRLSTRWPGRISFSGPDGRQIAPPDWIKSELSQ